MRLIVIGCSGPMSGRFSVASAYLLQADGEDEDGRPRTYSVVLDFGPGAMGQFLNYLDPVDPDAMVFSHLHTDHCADIIGMQVHRRWLPGGPLARIPVYSPGDGQYRTHQLGGDLDEETYEGEFEFKQIGLGDVVEMDPMKLEASAAGHTVPYVGLRMSGPSDLGPGKATLGYIGDTSPRDTEMEIAWGVDLLLLECASEDGRDLVCGVHMVDSCAEELAQRAGAVRLLPAHLQLWTDPEAARRSAERIYESPARVVLPDEEHCV